MNFYYTDPIGNVVGPITGDQLRQLVNANLLPSSTQVCCEGSEDWNPISTYIPQTEKVVRSPPAYRAPTPTPPLRLFVAVFFAVVVAGGCLMAGWYLFLQDKSAKPFTLSTNKNGESILERKGQVEGEVFIVTGGGQNYKLGLVPVALLSMETLQPYLDRKRSEADLALKALKPKVAAAKQEMDQAEDAKRAAWDALLSFPASLHTTLEAAHHTAQQAAESASSAYYALHDEERSYLSGAYYLDGLPEPLVTTQTNSDGKFTIEVPTKGQFAIAASAKRVVGKFTEQYYWLVKVSLDGSPKKTIMLSNNNLSSTSDSLINTL